MKKPIIFCVDDEKFILDSIKRDLKDAMGYEYLIEVVEDGQEAFSIFQEMLDDKYEIPLVICDYIMPNLKGDELLHRIHKLSPNTIKIMLTGQATVEGVTNAVNYANLYRYIAKPWDPQDFLLTIKEAIRSYYLNKQVEQQNQELKLLNENLESLVLKRTKELQESEERYRLLVELSPEAIFIHSENQFLFINYAGAQMFGADSPEQILEKSLSDFVNADFNNNGNRKLEEVIRQNQNKALLEYRITRVDGSLLELEAISTIFQYQGKTTIITIGRDITDRKRLERLRFDTERILKHDLKNPLTGIISITDSLLDDPWQDTNQKIQKLIYLINKNGLRMLQMLDHSLDLLKMEEGTYQLKLSTFNFIQMIEEIVKEFDILLKAKNIKVNVFFNNECLSPNQTFMVSGEQVHLKNLFSNLVKNAVEAAPNNSRVTATIKEGSDFYQIDIHNLGVVPVAIRHCFFDKYSTSGKDKGTGIGTYSALLIAKTHGGNISFSTSDEEGTNLIVTLPKKMRGPIVIHS